MARSLWLCCLLLVASSCATFDPHVFDERLRRATFKAYVGAIEAQFGGLEAAGVSADELRERYRERAASAPTPARFYRVLTEMLTELDDPHAVLRVSPRFWKAPVGEPEWTQFVSSRGGVWMGIPRGSLRTPAGLGAELRGWMSAFGGKALEDLNPREIAALLRQSAAFGGRRGRGRAREPLAWVRVLSIDGVEVETPHDAELLMRGRVGSSVVVSALVDGAPREIGLLRNAGVFEALEADEGVRRRLHPLELARLLDQTAATDGWRKPAGGTRAPVAASRARRRALAQSAFRRGKRLELAGSSAEAFGIEAWILPLSDGRAAAYLRIARFEPRADIDLPNRPTHEVDESGAASAVIPRLDATLAQAFGFFQSEFDGRFPMVVDVAGNGGGSWVETGLFLSYFLDPMSPSIPHSVESVSDRGTWPFRVRSRARQLLARADVPFVQPSNLMVLMDQGTASAGEITAETLRGLAGATLIGERTAGAEYSTAEFGAPDGSVLRIGLSGGMQAPLRSFQGRGIEPDISIEPLAKPNEPIDLEVWRAVFRFHALERALEQLVRAPSPLAEIP